MKRGLCLILVFILICSGCFSAYAADNISFEAKLTNGINDEIESFKNLGWNDSDLNRGLLVIFLELDLCNEVPSIQSDDLDLDNGAIVGFDGFSYRIIITLKNTKAILISYIPLLNKTDYAILENTSFESATDVKDLLPGLKDSFDDFEWTYLSMNKLSNAAVYLKSILED